VGTVRFRPEAAHAANALQVDLIVFTEYFPQQNHDLFCKDLEASGLAHQFLSKDPEEKANRVLIASRYPLAPEDIVLPTFDHQFPANIAAVRIPGAGLRVLGLRVPAYEQKARELLIKSWDWLESAAVNLRHSPAIIIGDLNIRLSSRDAVGGAHFRRILNNGWTRFSPNGGHSYYGSRGIRSEIDHVLVTNNCRIRKADYVLAEQDFKLAGTKEALPDHAALVAVVEVM
jgi:endonuclease/exonuclease/phosphatase family metal-dependent hydrolase